MTKAQRLAVSKRMKAMWRQRRHSHQGASDAAVPAGGDGEYIRGLAEEGAKVRLHTIAAEISMLCAMFPSLKVPLRPSRTTRPHKG